MKMKDQKKIVIANKSLQEYCFVVLLAFQQRDVVVLSAKYRNAGKLERLSQIFLQCQFVEEPERVEFAGTNKGCLEMTLEKIPAARS